MPTTFKILLDHKLFISTSLEKNNLHTLQFIDNCFWCCETHNHRIHARVNNDIWQSLDGLIVEGGLYEISTFTLTNSSAFLRPVSSTRSIRFLNVTTVQPYMDTSRSFPEHGFEFVSVDEVQRITERNNADELPFHTIGMLCSQLFIPPSYSFLIV